MAEWHDTDGGPVCGDCLVGCPRPAHWESCDRDGCCCPCRQRVERSELRTLDEVRTCRGMVPGTVAEPAQQRGDTRMSKQFPVHNCEVRMPSVHAY